MTLDGEDANRIVLVTKDGAPGLTYQQSRGLVLTSRGVRISGTPNPGDRRRAAIAGVNEGNVVSIDAARIWDLPLPPWLWTEDARIEISVSPDKGQPRRRDTKGHRFDLPEHHVTQHEGLRVTTPARTWLDCAAIVTRPYVIAMGDAILHKGLASHADLKDMLHWGFRRRGVAIARRALPQLNAASESPGESIARMHILDADLPAPVANYVLEQFGRFLGRLDLAWPEFRVCLEYDGIVHLDEEERRKDSARRNRIQDAGWIVLVITAEDFRFPVIFLGQLRRALESRGWR